MSELVTDAEVECLKLKKQINDSHRFAQQAAVNALERGVHTGELFAKWKELLPHGRFTSFVETHFDGSLRTAQAYMLASKRFNALPNAQKSALLSQGMPISGLLEKPKTKKKPKKTEDEPEQEASTEELGEDEEWVYEEVEEELPEDETLEECCKRETADIESWARNIGKMLSEAQAALESYPTLDELNARTGWERKLKEALATLRGTKPVKCPLCDGDSKKCPCKGNGRVTKQQYNQMV